MGAIIAFSGKGGSGKTTLAAMFLRRLLRAGHRPVLAVDADPNATLGEFLGVAVEGSIADLRDQMGQAAQRVSAIPKQRLLEQMLQQCLTEAEGFDLLTMGRPEGPHCYCYVNSLLRRYLKELRNSYAAVVVDCEAGMEYLSRLTVDDVELLVLVAEATAAGLRTVGRITALADSLPVKVGRRVLAVNKVGRAPPAVEQFLPPGAADAVIEVPLDADLAERAAAGAAIDDAAGPAAAAAVEELIQMYLLKSSKPASA